MKIKPHSLIAIDFDGVIALGDMWSLDKFKPNKPIVDLMRAWMRERQHLIVYTARREEQRFRIEQWLKENKIPYHALVMDKLPADVYIDDKAINVKDIFKK